MWKRCLFRRRIHCLTSNCRWESSPANSRMSLEVMFCTSSMLSSAVGPSSSGTAHTAFTLVGTPRHGISPGSAYSVYCPGNVPSSKMRRTRSKSAVQPMYCSEPRPSSAFSAKRRYIFIFNAVTPPTLDMMLVVIESEEPCSVAGRVIDGFWSRVQTGAAACAFHFCATCPPRRTTFHFRSAFPFRPSFYAKPWT